MGTALDRSALLIAITVYYVEYTLAAEARYLVARDQCLNVYQQLTEFDTPKDMLCIKQDNSCSPGCCWLKKKAFSCPQVRYSTYQLQI